MRRQPPYRRRPRIGLCGRAAAWLVAFALLVECSVSAGAALGMWMAANGPSQMAQGHCAEHATSGKQDQRFGHAGHDHEHCLLCNAAAGDCPVPVLPFLSAAPNESIVPATTPESVTYRKVVHANTARGPPEQA
jgi:hypothetical protein